MNNARPHSKRPLVSRRRVWIPLVLFLALGGPRPAAQDNASQVSAELVVPNARTHVIGDPIPLIWRFENRGKQPVAFLWEGCCRLNGRLDISTTNGPVDLIPPAQALAHMFARAAQLDPNSPSDFETRLSDWVKLAESGTYHLQGRYVGVLPSQHPRVPQGVGLWRGEAITPVLPVTLLGIRDYLSERKDRNAARGLALQLSGPSELPALAPSPLHLKIHNLSATPLSLLWPSQFQLWVLNSAGERLDNVPTFIESNYEEITLEPGSSWESKVPFSSDWVEGQPFGPYQVFVDLAAGPEQQPRVPSNPVSFAWDLDRLQVARLIQSAAEGPKTGFRNAALKLLRVYLGDLRSMLPSIQTEEVGLPAAPLLHELKLAACLKPLAPNPGPVELGLRLPAGGQWAFAASGWPDCLEEPAAALPESLRQVLDVRRHLGWEIRLFLYPDGNTTARQLAAALESLALFKNQLFSSPRFVVDPNPSTANRHATADQVTGQPELEIYVKRSDRGVPVCQVEWPVNGTVQSRTIPVETSSIAGREEQPPGATGSLGEIMKSWPAASAPVSVRVANDLAWKEVQPVLQAVLEHGFQANLRLDSH